MDFVRHSVEIYKSFIRPFLANSKIYHHTPDPKKSDFSILELTASDKTKGVIAAFILAGIKGSINIRAKGADQSKQYKVTLDNDGCSFVVSGRELKQNGIIVDIPSSMSSELVLYEVTE